MNPKVFVSHASEDKDRFVSKFATKLRENGVDAWLDKWEMLPGDSLVDKIFEEPVGCGKHREPHRSRLMRFVPHCILPGYLKGEYEDRFSMSGLGLQDADNEIVRLVKELHLSGRKIILYLNKPNAKIFEQYLRDSQTEYGAAKESWGQWYNDDDIAADRHTEETIAGRVEWLLMHWQNSNYLHNTALQPMLGSTLNV